MTLSELLEELKQIDPEEWEIIMHGIPLTPMSQYFTFDHGETTAHRYHSTYLPFSQMERDVALIWLQGCLQRACEMRGWFYGQFSMAHPGPFCADVTDSNNVDHYGSGIGDSSAEALLAAYIAAVRASQ